MEMHAISYEEAAQMLQTKYNTIQHATSRGVITPLPRIPREYGRLAYDQVKLFVGKRITLKSLSTDELTEWHTINRQILSLKQKNSTFMTDSNALASAMSVIDGVIALFTETIIRLQNDGPNQLTADKLVTAIMQSPDFNQTAALLGLDIDQMSVRTFNSLHDALLSAVHRSTYRIAVSATIPQSIAI